VGSDRTEDYGEMHEVLQGDTVIDGLSYKKVQTTTPYSSYSDFALREEDRKVYAYVFSSMAVKVEWPCVGWGCVFSER